MNQLKKKGYEIESVQNKGYHLVKTPDILSKNELVSIRKTKWVGTEICYFDVTDSTNTQAKSLGEGDAPNGTLVVAGKQESGRGRRAEALSPLREPAFHDPSAPAGDRTAECLHAYARLRTGGCERH